MPAVSYGTGGCTTCRAGVPAPPPVSTAQAAAPTFLQQAKGLPWWVWVLGILALASAYKGRR